MTYTISKYDPGDTPGDDFEWTKVAESVSLWALRSVLRDLQEQGYERDVSISVSRDEYAEHKQAHVEQGLLLFGDKD